LRYARVRAIASLESTQDALAPIHSRSYITD
jgi:hypothetical protein